jgi:hypothetical protein
MKILKKIIRKIFNIIKRILEKIRILISYIKIFILFPPSKIAPVIKNNRQTLKNIPKWIDDDIYDNAIYFYGVPKRVKHILDSDVGNDLTYSDVMLYLSQKLKKKINYLEMGVSVGKNFYQVLNYLKNSQLVGFDIENINPVLEKLLTEGKTAEQWNTIEKSMKKDLSSKKTYKYPSNNNSVQYISGDVWDENSWKRLEGNKFNMIFSDAVHSPEALIFEHDMLKKYNLIDDEEFVILWDDLGDDMTKSFDIISNDLKKNYDLKKNNIMILPLSGWLGINEHKHEIGIIINIKKN